MATTITQIAMGSVAVKALSTSRFCSVGLTDWIGVVEVFDRARTGDETKRLRELTLESNQAPRK